MRRGAPALDSNGLETGAREARAGYAFEVLWAARAALRLLDPSAGLAKVRLEGLPPAELSVQGDQLQGIDLTEYFGGDSLASAKRIVVSQLKYSSRHPDRTWTAARVAASSRRHGPSILQRLAQAYTAVAGSTSRRHTSAHLEIRLVSNRPISLGLARAVRNASAALSSSPQRERWRALARLGDQDRREVDRLKAGSRLTSADFAGFLLALNLSHCGQPDLLSQEARLSEALDRHGASRKLNDFYRHVEKEAMPDRRFGDGLRVSDVLAGLGAVSSEALFPCPTLINRLSDPITTPDAGEVVKAIAASQRVVVHGDAGTGKTTTLAQVPALLPPNSGAVLFDCFGSGDYLTAGGDRHTPHRALLHLINSIALECGTPFLVEPPRELSDLWRRFEATLVLASETLGSRKLVIAIDAADNAVYAARSRGDRCFVQDLWRTPLPPNVTIVMTARTGRTQTLNAPGGTLFVPLQGFDLPGSSMNLRRAYQAASANECAAFHENTAGNPRVQYYVLSEAQTAGSSVVDVLERARLTPRQLFDDLVTTAFSVFTEPAMAKHALSILLAVSRPARLEIVAGAAHIPIDEIVSFTKSLRPGVLIEGSGVAFRDEDFEVHLANYFNPSEMQTAHRQLATYLLPRISHDPLAATAIADHLYQARMSAEIVDLALDPEPSCIADPLTRGDVYRRRLRLAMAIAAGEGAIRKGTQLALLAAESSRADSALVAFVREWPELAMAYGDPISTARLYLREDAAPWRGPAHLKMAAALIEEGNRPEAAQQLDMARAWIQQRSHLGRHERHDWHLSSADIAAGVQTIYGTQGFEPAANWARSWRPRSIIFQILDRVAERVAHRGLSVQLSKEALDAGYPWWVAGALIGRGWDAGNSVEQDLVTRLLDGATRSESATARLFGKSWLISLLEAICFVGGDRDAILRVLNKIAPRPYLHINTDYDDLADRDVDFRREALIAALENAPLEGAVFLRKHEDARNAEGDDRQALEALGEILPLYETRACFLVSQDASTVDSKVLAQLDRFRNAAGHRWFRRAPRFRTWLRLATDLLLRVPGDPTATLGSIAESVPTIARGLTATSFLDMAEVISTRAVLQLGLNLLSSAVQEVERRELPARDRVAILGRAAAIASRVDRETSRDYYERAVSAAAGLDDEAARVLSTQCRLARVAGPAAGSPTRRLLAQRLVAAIQHYWNHVSDSDRLPIDETLEVAGLLDLTVGVATASRWDDEGRVPIARSVLAVIKALHDADWKKAPAAVAVARLAGEQFNVVDAFIPWLDDLASKGTQASEILATTVRELANRVLRDVPAERRCDMGRRLVAWADVNRQGGLKAIGEIRLVLNACSDPAESVPPDIVRTVSPESDAPPIDYSASLEEVLTRLADRFADKAAVLSHTLSRWSNRTLSSSLGLMQAIASLPADSRAVRSYADVLLQAVGECIAPHASSPTIDTWLRTQGRVIARDWFHALIQWPYGAPSRLSTLIQLAPSSKRPLMASYLLERASEDMGELSSDQWCAVADAVATSLMPQEALEVVNWSLSRLPLEVDPIDGVLPADSDQLLAHLLWALFAHPDKRVRWRSAHAARAIATYSEAFLSELIGLLSAVDPGCLRSRTLYFYWLSARQWLVMVLSRLLVDGRGSEELLTALVGTATDRAMPHASIREMARRSVLAAEAIGAHSIDPLILARVEASNQPTSCFAERRSPVRSREFIEAEGRRFQFDTMDTTRYWFAPLGEVFDLTADDVAKRAEAWIVDRWGMNDDSWWKDARELSNDWRQTSHSHGTVPEIETMRSYLEFHSMLLVAGELIDEGAPILVGDFDDDEFPWQHWLDRYVDADAYYWLSDIRTATPVGADVVATKQGDSSSKSPSREAYKRQLFVTRPEGRFLVAHGHRDLWDPEQHETVRVTSALVEPQTSLSLLSALQSAADPNDFRLPLADEGTREEGGMEINHGPFRLRGWIKEVRRDRESMDEHDPLARIKYSWSRPSLEYVGWLGAVEPRGTEPYVHDGVVRVITEVWSDAVDEQRDRILSRFTNGHRTLLREADVESFLADTAADLIIEVHIAWNKTSERREETYKYDLGTSRLFLIRSDHTFVELA